MVGEFGEHPKAVVVADDAELGGLVALNLRRRGLLVEQTDFALAVSSYWAPANGRPTVVVFDAERPGTDIAGSIRHIRSKSWMIGVPLVLAADRPSSVVDKIDHRDLVICTRPDDVGGIIGAALALIGNPESALPKATQRSDRQSDKR